MTRALLDHPSPERVAYIALGSNVGDRAAHLAMARRSLATLPASHLIASSTIEETAPLGDVPQGPYLNQMVALQTRLPADELLALLHGIEREAGRVRRERWGPRTLDLDIVLVEGESRADDRLVLPHPGLAERPFWQRELAELREGRPLPRPAALDAGEEVDLPPWAVVSASRRGHIARVTSLLDRWAEAMELEPSERRAWHDAGRWHDALRDADEATLRSIVADAELPAAMLHGPAAAARLAEDGERRTDVLDAVRLHTIGSPDWARTGRALYMADFLEPGRAFAPEQRAALAMQVPGDFDGVFRAVVRERIAWALREGRPLYPECVAMWNRLQA